ncbi:hypothetical protein PQU92_11650 [Asticcacaulis sp. BYS171W]|uniref:Uncharacterized protein n=1 Tax=Asticcacaulis aquaticus TaxID=2984212 RepID=A0ABT5HVG5_9CAUL|nr:hypothetical protein [Asticcacaulis aquaticus]MDC7683933.1 hypothetical protein [Asticcacaulis aquaticus]
MSQKRAVWFRPIRFYSSYWWVRTFIKKPVEPDELFLFPCTWQGALIYLFAGGLAYGTARLALYLYTIKPEYGWAGWGGFALVCLATMMVATHFSDRR